MKLKLSVDTTAWKPSQSKMETLMRAVLSTGTLSYIDNMRKPRRDWDSRKSWYLRVEINSFCPVARKYGVIVMTCSMFCLKACLANSDSMSTTVLL